MSTSLFWLTIYRHLIGHGFPFLKMNSADIISYPLTVGSTLTRIVECGEGDDVVLFIHGVAARADRWVNNLPVIAKNGFRAIAVDLPGHGFAQKGGDFNYTVPGFADFVRNVVDVLALRTPHLVGTSLGGHIAGTVAASNPRQFQSLTLVGCTGMFPIGEETRARIAERISDLSREGIEKKLRSLLSKESMVTKSLIDQEWRINNSDGAQQAFDALGEYFLHKLDEDVIGKRLDECGRDLPKLLIWGECDSAVPLAIGKAVEALLGTKPHAIPETAHAPYWEDPDAFNEILVNFLLNHRKYI